MIGKEISFYALYNGAVGEKPQTTCHDDRADGRGTL